MFVKKNISTYQTVSPELKWLGVSLTHSTKWVRIPLVFILLRGRPCPGDELPIVTFTFVNKRIILKWAKPVMFM